MSVWFTSDLHLGHALVEDERRHWTGGLHSEFLADNWDSQVKNDHVVWVLGDISSGKGPDQAAALAWIGDRPGRKRLILGNHDGPHPAHRDAPKWFGRYANYFEHISTSARIRLHGEPALLSHFPYVGDHSLQDRYTQYRLPDEGLPILHGHTHSQWARSRWVHHRQLHVGLDTWHGLVSLDAVHEVFKPPF